MEQSFLDAVNHAMVHEVGPFWRADYPALSTGKISNSTDRKMTGYVNDPDDSGGETKFGIAKNANPELDIAGLTWDAAKRVYYRQYWLAGNCDDISVFAPRLAIMMFDICVNHGIGRAAKMLQEAVGATIDGDIGPKTLELVKKACAGSGGELAVCEKVASIRVSFYNTIVKNKPTQSKFLNGWLGRNKEVLQYVKTITKV